jgi:hypothetical protein
MKKLSLSKFDLGIIIAFAVVALLGAGAWWYLSGELQSAQGDVANAKSDFDKYSAAAAASTKEKIVVSPSNEKTLESNIDVLKTQLDPLIETKLLPKENTLRSIGKEDPVAWKHDLDDEVHRLNGAAKVHGVALPSNFYFGFSRYLSQSPGDEQTAVLSKQLVGVEQIATTLIEAPVKGIQAIRRTYEEDPHTGSGNPFGSTKETDHLEGYSVNPAGNLYIAYPFEIDFETNSENLRAVVDKLIQSPYLFVVRSISIQNSTPNSPLVSELDKLAGPPPSNPTEAAPGEVAATSSTKGPQFLFGNSTLKIKARIDMIEWKVENSQATPAPGPVAPHPTPSPSPGANR